MLLYPFDYVTEFLKFKETRVPKKEAFCSKLNYSLTSLKSASRITISDPLGITLYIMNTSPSKIFQGKIKLYEEPSKPVMGKKPYLVWSNIYSQKPRSF